MPAPVTLKIPTGRLSCLVHSAPALDPPTRGRECLRATLEASGVALFESNGLAFEFHESHDSYQSLLGFIRANSSQSPNRLTLKRTPGDRLLACAGCASKSTKGGRSKGNYRVRDISFGRYLV
jgi:hypothetical protein